MPHTTQHLSRIANPNAKNVLKATHTSWERERDSERERERKKARES